MIWAETKAEPDKMLICGLTEGGGAEDGGKETGFTTIVKNKKNQVAVSRIRTQLVKVSDCQAFDTRTFMMEANIFSPGM